MLAGTHSMDIRICRDEAAEEWRHTLADQPKRKAYIYCIVRQSKPLRRALILSILINK